MTERSKPTTDPFQHVIDAAPSLRRRLVRPEASPDEGDTLALLLRSVRRWAADAIDGAAIDAEARIPRPVLEGAAELGLFGLGVPEEHGGAGLSMGALAEVIAVLAEHDRSVAVTVGLHGGLGLRGLERFGSSAQHERWLPGLASGETIAAFAATEPGAGSHIAGLRATAEAQPDGTLRLDGEKIFVTNGGLAGLFTVLARTPGLGSARSGCSMLVLDPAMDGLTVGPEEHKLGIKGSSTTSLFFDGVVVTPDRVLGEPGQGLAQLDDVLSRGRTLMAAGCLGTARAALDRTLDHVLQRQQFGRPLARFDLVRQRVVQMRLRTRVLESVLRLTTTLADRQADIGWCSAITKVLGSDGAWQVVDDAIQLHGGVGFIEETGVARMLRDCRITRIFEGANDVLRLHVALGLTDRAPAPAGLVAQLSPALASPAGVFDSLRVSLYGAVERLRAKYKLRLVQQQLALAGVADATIAAWALLAHLTRIDGELRSDPPAGRAQQLTQEARLTTRWLAGEVSAALVRAEREEETDAVRSFSDALYGSEVSRR